MIIQISRPIQMVVSIDFKCENCRKTETEKYPILTTLYSKPTTIRKKESEK
jgi:hypothetical protein